MEDWDGRREGEGERRTKHEAGKFQMHALLEGLQASPATQQQQQQQGERRLGTDRESERASQCKASKGSSELVMWFDAAAIIILNCSVYCGIVPLAARTVRGFPPRPHHPHPHVLPGCGETNNRRLTGALSPISARTARSRHHRRFHNHHRRHHNHHSHRHRHCDIQAVSEMAASARYGRRWASSEGIEIYRNN